MVVRGWLAFLMGCAGLAGCVEERLVSNTELMLVADTDIADLDHVEFEINDGSRSRTAVGDIRSDGTPLSLAILREQGSLGPVEVSARGFSGESLRVERHAVVSFVPNVTVVVTLHLLDSCTGVECGEGQTCTERGCESELIDADDLPRWSGTAPRLPGLDAGLPADAGLDATLTADAELDAELDAGLDAALTADAEPSTDASGDTGQDAALTDAGDAGDAGDAAVLTECGGDSGLVDLNTNVNHCGKCGRPCTGYLYPYLNIGWACKAAKCVYACAPLYGNCDLNNDNGCEKTLTYDSSNCGMCGNKCGSGEYCSGQGRCVSQ